MVKKIRLFTLVAVSFVFQVCIFVGDTILVQAHPTWPARFFMDTDIAAVWWRQQTLTRTEYWINQWFVETASPMYYPNGFGPVVPYTRDNAIIKNIPYYLSLKNIQSNSLDYYYVRRIGFPFGACECSWSYQHSPIVSEKWIDGIIWEWHGRYDEAIVFPVRISVIPFIANIAVVALLLWAGYQTTRRVALAIARPRSGCPRCGYPIVPMSSKCPECGTNIEVVK